MFEIQCVQGYRLSFAQLQQTTRIVSSTIFTQGINDSTSGVEPIVLRHMRTLRIPFISQWDLSGLLSSKQ